MMIVRSPKRGLRMSRWFAALALVVSTAALLTASFDAEAQRRFGGGGSFGRQSSNVLKQRQAVTPPAANTAQRAAVPAAAAGAAGTAAKSGASRWLGPLAGIAAGIGLASLLSYFGLSGALLEFLSSALLIGLVVFGVMFLLRRLRGGALAMQSASTGRGTNGAQRASTQPLWRRTMQPAQATPAAMPPPMAVAQPVDPSWFIPDDFDVAAFLAQAKKQFVHIQGIWDSGRLDQLGEYLTDDLVAEMKPQLQAREAGGKTEVILLNAELLGIEQVAGGHLASVRYSGMLREANAPEAFRFEEVWNLYKQEGQGWLLAGIQQIPVQYAS